MNFIDWLFALVGLVGGLGFGWMRTRQLMAGAVSRPQYDKVVEEKTTLAVKLETVSETLNHTQSRLTEFHERALAAEADNRALEQRLKDQQEQLRAEFKNTSTSIFEEMSKKFSTHSEKQIGDLLNPFREKLGEFHKMVGEAFSTQGKEQYSLKNEIEKIARMNDGLTKALRGDVKAQGNWGEVMLERILEESGLRRDEDYIVQAADMGLSGVDGARLRPDVIVRLPENKHIIIDAKVSLVAYDRYCSEAEEVMQDTHLKDFLKSIKAHVNALEQKRYQNIEKLGTPDFVLMFMPIEGAYSLAIQHDRELHSYAWGRKIVLVCPATLFATLRTIASLWRIESQNRNAQEIARQGGALYDKFVGFIEDMQGIGKQAARLQDAYDQAMRKLSTGAGNLIGRVEKLKQLGATASKSLPMTGDEEVLAIEDADQKIKMVS
jgi:DNA recombination protein RmuC